MRTIEIKSVADISATVKDVRKHVARITQTDAAFYCRVSPPFLNKLENNAESCRLGLVLQVFERLGIQVTLTLPENV